MRKWLIEGAFTHASDRLTFSLAVLSFEVFFLSHSSFFIIAFQLTRVPHLPNSRALAAISVFEGELDIIRKTTTGKVTRDAGNFEIFYPDKFYSNLKSVI